MFEIEEGAAPPRGAIGDLAARALQALEAGKRAEAPSELCRRVLAVSPENTTALHVQACLCELEGKHGEALQLQLKVLDIEPNLRPYRFWMMERVAAQGLLQSFLVQLGELKARWPRERRMDSLAARVLLALGRPAEAAKLELSAGGTAEAALAEQVVREAKACAEARRELATARDATLSERAGEALAALRRAHGLYAKGLVVALNLGAALLRAADWRGAYDVLAPVAAIAPSWIQAQCLGSMAFALASRQ